MNTIDGVSGSAERRTNRDKRGAVIPIVTVNNNSILAEVSTSETEVVSGESSISIDEAIVMRKDGLIKANLFAGQTTDILTEAS